MHVEKGYVPRVGVDTPLIVTYARNPERYMKALETTSSKGRKANSKFYRIELNRGTIVNTTPTIGRNARVSVDGAPPQKLKRTVLAHQPRPYRIKQHAQAS